MEGLRVCGCIYGCGICGFIGLGVDCRGFGVSAFGVSSLIPN